MYAPHFGLQQEAFSIAPDPRFLHLSAGHREALAHLLYGLQGGGGFVLLTGEIGAGKTTVCRCFLEQVPATHRVAYVYNPKLTPLELLQTVCQEFGLAVEAQRTLKPYIDALNTFLLQVHAQGGHSLLVVDEAQALSPQLLEMLRLLTNLETAERKLLQIVLIGQPELRDKLATPELEQLSQRVIARVHLGPLSAPETAAYVEHRLQVAGLKGRNPFDRRALALVHRLTGGVPRRINLLCQRALVGAYAQGRHDVDVRLVRQAAREAFDGAGVPARRTVGWRWAAAGAGATLALVAGMLGLRGLGGLGGLGGPDATRDVRSAASASRVDGAVIAQGVASTAASGAGAPAVPSASAQPWTDRRAAWSALAQAWGGGTAADCQDAAARELACHQGVGDLALLRRLDRPALLQLADGGLLLLRAVGAQHVTVVGAGGPRQLSPEALAQLWPGAYATWWRPPPGWGNGRQRPAPEAATWTLERLTALQGPLQGQQASASPDEVLQRRVFAFQVAQQLPLDGLAGPLTLMQLNRASGVDEPHLAPETT